MAEGKGIVSVDALDHIAVCRFATARAQEIVALTNMIENPQNTKLIFQKLPIHMRRRAMSHKPNRMPRILREAHKAQMAKSGLATQPKRPRRKYRRRPTRLLEEYTKRSSKCSWLETHIWHAKRFHMTSKWGYKLPESSCARSHRFNHRSVTKHCMLMDLSYLCCIEVRGPEKVIIERLSCVCDPRTGPTFGAVAFLNGYCEGRVMVFKRNNFSSGPIGLVTFIWRSGETPAMRTLWIWSHPAFYQELFSELTEVLNYEAVPLVNTASQVTLNKVKLNRFRLRGPLAYSVLSTLFERSSQNIPNGSHSPGYIIGTEVRDPRMILAQSRVKPELMPATSETKYSSQSKLWDASLREKITETRKLLSDCMIHQRRSQLLVPGSELPIQPDEIPIPILIVNAFHESNNFVTGCDVIFPDGWGTAFWLSLTYSGGHPGGLKDAARMNFEHGICRDLCLEIDSEAGKVENAKQKVELMDQYFRKPPKVRSNFIKLATPFPFGIDWDRLFLDWMAKMESSFTVLRDKKIINSLALVKHESLPESLLSQPFLIPVTIRVKHGSPSDFAMICLPEDNDNCDVVIREPVHKDPGAKERKILREQHKAVLKNLARKRKENKDKKGAKIDYSGAEVIARHKEKMRSLWLPSSFNLKTSYARPVAGFITKGDFGLREGKGFGRGYVIIQAFFKMTKRSVLVRNPGTDLYMWADITVG